MTMRITVKNEDQNHTAVVTVIDHGAEHTFETDTKLAPGEQKEFWVYSGRSLVVKEVLENK
jgi:hypothetical protein